MWNLLRQSSDSGSVRRVCVCVCDESSTYLLAKDFSSSSCGLKNHFPILTNPLSIKHLQQRGEEEEDGEGDADRGEKESQSLRVFTSIFPLIVYETVNEAADVFVSSCCLFCKTKKKKTSFFISRNHKNRKCR